MSTQVLRNEAATIHRRSLIARYLLGLLTGLAGITNMVSALVPRPNWDMFFGVWPIDALHGIHKLLIVSGFFLLMLSYGLVRGKRQAWYAVMLMLLLSAFLHILSKGPVIVTLTTVLLLTLLAVFMPSFRAKSNPPSVWRGHTAFLFGLGVVTVYTVGGFVVLYRQFEPLVDRLGLDTVILLLLSNAHMHLTYGSEAFFFERVLPSLCLSAIIYGIVMILRPVTATLLPDEQEQHEATTLTRLYGTNSISYFALETGKSYFFSASGRSMISYVLEGNVAVVAGDPIGREEEIPGAIQEFVDFCRQQDWTIVFWQVRDKFAKLYLSNGLHILKIGEDAIVDTRTFTLAGKAMANVRSSAKRAEKEGLHVVFYRGSVQNSEQLAQMERISQEWLAHKGNSEMGFSMGRFSGLGDEKQITAVAISASNTVHGFVTFIPIFGRNGWGLDLMRRAEHAAPGTMELLLSRSVDYLKKNGASMVSLGLAPLANTNSPDETFLYTSIDFLTRLFGDQDKNQSLFNFKKKFQPQWESRYLVYSSTLTLPKVGWALYHAHLRNASLLSVLCTTAADWRRKRQALHQKLTGVIEKTKRGITGELSL